MCLAIYKPKGITVPEEHLLNGFESNPHGAGFAFVDLGGGNNPRLETRKGFFKYGDFLAEYQKVMQEQGNPAALIHFRYATHGKRNEFNCHPWEVCGGKYMAVHNGIIDIASTDEKSDTGHFIDSVLTPGIKAFGDPADPVLKYLVEQSIGGGNKIAVMDSRGKVTIYNEKSGHWLNGAWYSNEGYLNVFEACSFHKDAAGFYVPKSRHKGNKRGKDKHIYGFGYDAESGCYADWNADYDEGCCMTAMEDERCDCCHKEVRCGSLAVYGNTDYPVLCATCAEDLGLSLIP